VRRGQTAYIFSMSAGQAVLVVGVSLVIIAVMIAVMIRLGRVQRRSIQRRREAWKAAGGVGPGPDDYIGHGGGYSSFGG
jgi:hypothetical protein